MSWTRIASFAFAGSLCVALAGAQPAPSQPQTRPPDSPNSATAAVETPPAAPISTPEATPARTLSPLERADIFMARKMYRDAIDSYTVAAENIAVIYNKIGIAYQYLSDTRKAEDFYKQALKVKPEYSEAWNNLGTVYYARKKYKDATKYYEKALKFSPDSASIHSNLGTAYFARKKYDDAMKEYQLALKLDPMVFETRGTQGVLLEDRTVEERAKFYFYLARAYARSGQSDLALQNLRKALESGYAKVKEEMEKNPDFASLRDNPEFQRLLKLEPRVL
jgi:tetratricopeptide (TPR) repeat protein